MRASDAVIPGAESVRVPSRSKRTHVQVRATVADGGVVVVGLVIAVLWYVTYSRATSALAESGLDVRAGDDHGVCRTRIELNRHEIGVVDVRECFWGRHDHG